MSKNPEIERLAKVFQERQELTYQAQTAAVDSRISRKLEAKPVKDSGTRPAAKPAAGKQGTKASEAGTKPGSAAKVGRTSSRKAAARTGSNRKTASQVSRIYSAANEWTKKRFRSSASTSCPILAIPGIEVR